jgi:hypothetical protein
MSTADRQGGGLPHVGNGKSGTIVKGHLVRSTNDLYKPYGIGRVRFFQKGIAKVDFFPSVFMSPPYVWEE